MRCQTLLLLLLLLLLFLLKLLKLLLLLLVLTLLFLSSSIFAFCILQCESPLAFDAYSAAVDRLHVLLKCASLASLRIQKHDRPSSSRKKRRKQKKKKWKAVQAKLRELDERLFFFQKYLVCANPSFVVQKRTAAEQEHNVRQCGVTFEAKCDGFRTTLAAKVLNDQN